jgi:hypothetical protein
VSIVAAIVNAYNIYNSSSDVPPKTSLCRRQLLVAVFLGCSSFLESNSGYPEKYASEGNLVGKTKVTSVCLSASFSIKHMRPNFFLYA